MGPEYPGYSNALNLLNIPTLEKRREELTAKFSKKLYKSERHRDLLPAKRTTKKILRNNPSEQLKEPDYNTDRYQNSAIPYCTRIINDIISEAEILL